MKKNSRNLDVRILLILFLLSFALFVVSGITMALVHKDREITRLRLHVLEAEFKNREFVTSILSCANGVGFIVKFDFNNETEVSCKIESEWMDGRRYIGDKGRIRRRSK
jgi:hypothetical protein